VQERTGRSADGDAAPGGPPVPRRSRLYSQLPLGLGTPLIECLTSYINRLAHSYHVSVRTLVTLEILPRLDPGCYLHTHPAELGGFVRTRSIGINGADACAADWAHVLEQLTLRDDLRHLTVRPWAAGLPRWGLLRPTPAWCPGCYRAWQLQGQPAYQPVVWVLQALMICPVHHVPLQDRCPWCRKRQSALATRLPAGYCTQCSRTLAAVDDDAGADRSVDAAALAWQQWVFEILADLHAAGRSSGPLPWHRLCGNITLCTQTGGSLRQLGHRVTASKQLFSGWRNRTRRPSFPYLLRTCYAFGISPLQLLAADRAAVEVALASGHPQPPPTPRRTGSATVDRPRVEARLMAVLNGHEPPLAVPHLARQLGIGEKFLVRHYPRECALIATQYRRQRADRARERVARECAEVRQAMSDLHKEGTYPSLARVAARLSDPYILRRPEARAAWRALREDLGYAPLPPRCGT